MKLRPSHTCCGCVSLLVGVECIAFLTLVFCITIISSVSSSRTVHFDHIPAIPGAAQCFIGTWAFTGIVVAINGGTAALYRMDTPLRIFYMWLIATGVLTLGIPMWLLASGSLCDSMVSKEVQKLGSSFVCGFTEGLVFWWTLVIGLIIAYSTYVVWSAAEEITLAPTPELMKYSSALMGIQKFPEHGLHPLGNPRAAAFRPSTASPHLLHKSIGMAPGATASAKTLPPSPARSPRSAARSMSPSVRSLSPSAMGRAGSLPPTGRSIPPTMGPSYGAAVPQSFFPSPSSRMF